MRSGYEISLLIHLVNKLNPASEFLIIQYGRLNVVEYNYAVIQLRLFAVGRWSQSAKGRSRENSGTPLVDMKSTPPEKEWR